MIGHTQGKKKNYLKLLGAFVLGAVLTLAITGASGIAWQGKMMTDFEKETSGGAKPDDSVLSGLFGECNTTNCDLETMIEELHDEVGYSSWTLQELAKRQYDMAAYVGLWLTNEMDSLHDEVGYSSWTLDSLAKHQTEVAAWNDVAILSLHDEVGYSSWTLESLAKLLLEIYDEVN